MALSHGHRRRDVLKAGSAGLVVGLAGCPTRNSEDRDEIIVGAPGEGTIGYTAATSIVSILEDGGYDNLNVRVEAGVSSEEGVRQVGSANFPMSIVTSTGAYSASENIYYEADFDSNPVEYEPMQVFHQNEINVSVGSYASVDAEEVTLDDLEGLTFAQGPAGVGRLWILTLTEPLGLEPTGLNDAGIDTEIVAYTDIPTGVREGRFDIYPAYFVSRMGAPGWLQELTADEDSRVLDYTDEARENVEDSPFAMVEIPAEDVFEHDNVGVDTIPTASLYHMHVSGSHTSQELIYEYTKAVFENAEAFRDAHAGFHLFTEDADWVVNEAIAALDSTPVHPGAVQYYEEVGAWDDQAPVGEVDDDPEFTL